MSASDDADDAVLREAAVRAHHHGLTDPEWALLEQAQRRSAAEAGTIPGNHPRVPDVTAFSERMLWCIHCGQAIDPSSGMILPEGQHAPGASLDPDCPYCADRPRPT